MPLSVAIIGSGPSGCYTVEALLKRLGSEVRIDLIDRLPTPFGLVRAGVAPDHQSIKAVTRRFEKAATAAQVRYLGNLEVGRDVSLDELRGLYDAVVLATGAPLDRPLGIAGEHLTGVIGSAAFVGWYNGHPDHAALDVPLRHDRAVIIGNGNVALDCARILAKTSAELAASDIVAHARHVLADHPTRHLTLLGRRGPLQVAFTRQELVEMGELERAAPLVDPAAFPPEEADAAFDPGHRKVIATLREFAARAPAPERPVTVEFRFFARPVEILGDGRVESIRVERTRLEGERAVGTGEMYELPCGLIIPCIGYLTSPIEGAPFDSAAGRFANTDGVIAPGLFAAGWARRGPSGTIGTNKDDGDLAAANAAAVQPAGRLGPDGLDRLLAGRGVQVTSFSDWRTLDEAERSRARDPAPREKFVALTEMLETIRSR